MLRDIEKNSYNLYFKRDVEGFGLPMFKQKQSPDNYYRKTRLQREKKIKLSSEQENNPHGFAHGKNGYYPVWDINLLQKEV